MTTITIPTASAILTGITDFASTYFTEYVVVIYLVLGLVVAALAIKWLQGTGNRFFKTVFGRRGRRGRRR